MIYHSKPTNIEFNTKDLDSISKSGILVDGIFTRSATLKLSKLIGVENIQLVNSGTSALITAIITLQLPENSHIAIPDNTCSSVYFAVKNLGYTPVICDINNNNLAINIESLSSDSKQKLNAIVVVQPYGYPIDIDLYRKYNIPIIEDCATSIGAEINGKAVGSMGDISVFSFYATKMLTSGEGGAVATSNPNYYKHITDIISSDMPVSTKFSHFNFKFTEIQAILLNSQLDQFENFIKKRSAIAEFYNLKINNIKINKDLNTIAEKAKPVYYRYLLLLSSKEQADIFIEYSKNNGIVSVRPAYKTLNIIFNEKANTPISSIIFNQMVSVPIYPALNKSAQTQIVEMINKF